MQNGRINAVETARHGVPSDTRMVLLGTLFSSFGVVIETSVGLPLRIQPQIGDKSRLVLCGLVRSWTTPSPGLRLKVAEIQDVYMVVRGESVCKEVHPCRVK